jgi:cell division control protein 11
VNTLCGKKVLEGKEADDAEHAHIEEGVRIKPVTVGEWERLHRTASLYQC